MLRLLFCQPFSGGTAPLAVLKNFICVFSPQVYNMEETLQYIRKEELFMIFYKMKRAAACLTAVLLCAGLLSGCTSGAKTGNRLILDGYKFNISQATVKELTDTGLTISGDIDPETAIPAGTMMAQPILLEKDGVPAASMVIANPGKADMPLSRCRVYKLTGFYTIDGTQGASEVIYEGVNFAGYTKEKVEKTLGRPENADKTTDLSTLNQFDYSGPSYGVILSFDSDGAVSQVELDYTGYKTAAR